MMAIIEEHHTTPEQREINLDLIPQRKSRQGKMQSTTRSAGVPLAEDGEATAKALSINEPVVMRAVVRGRERHPERKNILWSRWRGKNESFSQTFSHAPAPSK